MKNFSKPFYIGFSLLLTLGWTQSASAQEYRTISGVNNNLQHPEWGAAGENVIRVSTNAYSDGIYLPGGEDRPNPRFISQMLFSQTTLVNNYKDISAFGWGWGQLIDHDFSLVDDHPTDQVPILVPMNDPYFDSNGSGAQVIPMKRSKFDPASGTGASNPRQHPNEITAFLDANFVYGSDPQRAAWLRTFQGGKLKVSTGNMMPFNTTDGEYGSPVDPSAPGMGNPLGNVKFYIAGDVRANENPFLATLHTLFLREHNRLCDVLAQQHPGWTDHQLYHHARKLVGAYTQAITYEEWLPTLNLELAPYQGYDPTVNAGIMNEFSAIAFRFGHTLLTGVMPRMDNDLNTIPEGDLLLRQAFFNVDAVRNIGIEPYIVGMSTLPMQDLDCKVIDDVRNFLFGQPGAGGMDLIAININRARERGIADYNTLRQDFGLAPKNSFNEITSDPMMALVLEDVYGEVSKIDPWVGFLAEDHLPGSMFGETMTEILSRQFEAVREGDRFYYENDPWLTPEEKEEIRNTRLSDIVHRNTDLTVIDDDIFILGNATTGVNNLPVYPSLDLTVSPVPTHGPATAVLTVEEPLAAQLQLIDLRGRTLWEQSAQLNPGENAFPLDLSRYPSSVYYLVIKTGLRTAAYKPILKLD